ncbi:MAG: hypothetical protein SGPRY_009272, partial [Prymnesium sp.]
GIDVVKSRMQGLGASRYRNAMHCVREIVKNEGVLALYKGIGPRMARVCCEARLATTTLPPPLTACPPPDPKCNTRRSPSL